MAVYVVGIDGSDTAARAAARARELAAASGATIHVVCAYAENRTVTIDPDPKSSSALAAAERVVEAEVESLRKAGVGATSAVAEGGPADVLLDEAARIGADMIVVGNRRMQGVSRVLGSVANKVAHHAPCDVLIVKTV